MPAWISGAITNVRVLKGLLWLLSAAPLVDLVARGLMQNLGAHPEEVFQRGTGTWCLVLLLVTLGVTPARRMLQWPDLIRVRRMLGLWSFAYACVHLLAFVAFEHGMDVIALMADALKRPFVAAGLLAFLSMLPLALTSNQWSMRKLGPNWKRLHRLVYLAAVIACVHFFLHRAGKANFADPMMATAVLAVLAAIRWRLLKP
jgi:sulfoxide reductase heme-binding subunit YedZ